ncbi:hypothetical protein N1F73_03165, partial [Mycoplasma sp. HS2188]|nr:hypothetical protein [Mycoplasma sp. HS2188]
RMGKSIKVEDLVKIIIVKPKVDEQTKICKLINNVDYVISLLQRKLEKLENIKNTLLEKMFV